MKKIVMFCMLFLMTVCMMSFMKVEADLPYDEGDGTEVNPYRVYTVEDLYDMRESGTTLTFYILMNDLDFQDPSSYSDPNTVSYGDVNEDGNVDGLLIELTTEKGWLPIGANYTSSYAVFDGNNHTISNLYINRTTNEVGLFSRLFGSSAPSYSIYDLSLLDVDITGANEVGALAGEFASAEVLNIYVTGEINGYHQVGGFTGSCNTCEIYNGVNRANVTGNDEVGGLIGQGYHGSDGGSYSIVNYGTVTGVQDQIGGLVGYSLAYDIDGGINFGDVNGGHAVGGIAGFSQSSSLHNNVYNAGNISGAYRIGGIWGETYYGSTLTNAISLGNVISDSGNSQSSFFAKYTTGAPSATSLARFTHTVPEESSNGELYGDYVDITNISTVFDTDNYLSSTFFDFSGVISNELPLLYSYGTTTIMPNQTPYTFGDFSYNVNVSTDVDYASNGDTITITATFSRSLDSAPTIELISPEVLVATTMVEGSNANTYEYTYVLSSMDSGNLIVNIVAPDVGTETLSNGNNYVTNLTIINQDLAITSSDEVNATGEYTLTTDISFKEYSLDNGDNWIILSESTDTLLITDLVDGSYTIIAKDIAGNVSLNSVTVSIDTVSPDTLPESDIPTGYVNYDVTITITGSSDNNAIDHYEYKIEDGAWVIYDEENKPVITAEGETIITFKAVDEAGNESNEVIESIYIDKTPAVIENVVDESYNNTDITPTFNEGTATLNGNVFMSGTLITSEGTYVLIVTDQGGNVTNITFTIDKTVPIITGVSESLITNMDLNPTYNEGTAMLNGVTYVLGTTISTEDTYTLIVTDLAGNETTVSFTIDKTAPLVTGVDNSQITNEDLEIAFNEGIATLNGSTFASGSTISDEGIYTLAVTDSAGNETSISFEIDKTAPLVNGVLDGATLKGVAEITFNEGTATLNGVEITSPYTTTKAGEYELIITDEVGNANTINFTVELVLLPYVIIGVVSIIFISAIIFFVVRRNTDRSHNA